MLIEVKDLSFVYGAKTPYEKRALNNVTFSVDEGEFLAVVGATGSGKSTLIQHLNGLIRLQSGSLRVFDIDLAAKKPDLKRLRKGIGMLFQYPEYQLFADTVIDDVMFGPINFGMKNTAYENAKNAIELVGLDFDEIQKRSPLEISGGQKRRVAIAGILACDPQILVLDEPTAGLDPAGKRDMLKLISKIAAESKKTVIMVSHNMDEIAEYARRVIVLKEGGVLYDTKPAKLFYEHDVVSLGLDMPHTVKIVKELRIRGINLPDILTKEELALYLKNNLQVGKC